MATYGSYETVRELSSYKDRALFTGRKAGQASGEQYIIMVLSKAPTEGPVDTGGFFAEAAARVEDLGLARFEQSVEIQSKAAQASSRIAKVLESGGDSHHCWAVTPYFPRSVNKLIQGHVAMNEAGMYHIVHAVLEGLLAMQQACQRSHGNLHPANVLIGGSDKITEADVVLTDPAPGVGEEAVAFERSDLRVLGAMIYQLVQRKELTGSADWMILPLEKSREWTQVFGPKADGWLALCNRLLDTNADLGTQPTQTAAKELAALQPKEHISLKKVAVLTCLMVGGLLAVLFLFRSTRQSNILLRSDPGGVAILVDGKPAGKTPENRNQALQVNLKPGRHTLVGQFGNLVPYRAEIVVSPEGEVKVEVSDATDSSVTTGADGKVTIPITLDYATLVITSLPSPATVTFADKTQVSTPYTNLFARPGPLEFTVSLTNHVGWKAPEELVLEHSRVLVLGGTLEQRKPGQVDVKFSSKPFTATISEAQKRVDQSFDTPRTKPLDVGKYEFVAKSKNFPPQTKAITIEAGGGEQLVEFAFESVKVTLESQPPGAKVWVGDYDVSSNAGDKQVVTPLTIYWPPSPKTVFRFEKEGFETNYWTNAISGSWVTPPVQQLIPQVGTLFLVSDPPGKGIEMVVFSNNVPVLQWVTNAEPDQPIAIQRPPGEYVIEARYPGLAPVRQTHVFVLGKVERSPLRFAYGSLSLSAGPEAAGPMVLSLNDRPVELARAADLKLPPGSHRVLVTNAILGSVLTPIEVAAGARVVTNIVLPHGFLNITSVPPGALVTFKDGRGGAEKWKTPVNVLTRLGPIEYALTLVESNKTRQLKVDMTGSRSHGWNFIQPPPFVNSLAISMVWVADLQTYVGETEVTQGQFAALMAVPVSTGPNLPVVSLTYSQVIDFCTRLTQKDSMAGVLPEGMEAYSLPTVEQFGRCSGPAVTANAVFNTTQAAPVKSKSPNELGLYDVWGNVSEMCFKDSSHMHLQMMGKDFSSPSLLVGFAERTVLPVTDDNKVKSPRTGFRLLLVPSPSSQSK